MFFRFLMPFLVILLCVSQSQAATISVTTYAELTTALGVAVAGDEIVLANGTYSGEFFIGGNMGAPSHPLTTRAANPHQATMVGDNVCARDHEGFIASRPYWTIKDLRFQDHGRAISVYRNNVIISNNIIDHFKEEGIRVDGVDFPPVTGVLIERNIIAYGDTCTGTDSPGIYLVRNVDSATIRKNIVVATGDSGYQCAGVGGCGGGGDKLGFGMLVANHSDNNTIQGNLFLGNAGKGVFRILSDEFNSTSSDNNLVLDNMFLFGEGAGSTSDDCTEDSNTFVNNIAYGNYFWNWYTKGNINSLKGHMTLQHNLFYSTDFTRGNAGFALNICGGQPIGYKIANVVKDNIFYSNGALTGAVDTRILLALQGPQASILAANSNNLFWAPGSTATWVNGYTYAGSDIHAFGTPPIFQNEANGDFSLTPGSAGRSAASDGTDMGPRYNGYLNKSWMRRAFQLPTQIADPVTTSASFTVDPAHWYQVWFYIPTSSVWTSTETFVVEGTSLVRDINTLNTDTTWTHPGGPARWITLGRHKATDGTLNITWGHAGSASKIFIRQLPTADEAYQWLKSGSGRLFHMIPQ